MLHLQKCSVWGALCLFAFAGPAIAGTLTLGSGVAIIPQGTEIEIQAAPPIPGKVFDQWIGDAASVAAVDDVEAANTTVTMTATNISLTATYKIDPNSPPPPPEPPEDPVPIQAAMETDSVGDPDDMWLWVHPTTPSQSILIAADKTRARFRRFDLTGDLLGDFGESGRPNNVDGRGNFFACSLRDADAVGLYTVDPSDGTISKSGEFDVGVDAYGFCLYQSPTTQKLYAFVSGNGGDIEQWEINTAFNTGTLVRTLDTLKVEGMAVHDSTARLFYAEEHGSLTVIGAEPNAPGTGISIASTSDDPLTSDLEGVTIVGDHHVIVSVQGAATFAVYDLNVPYAYRGSFYVSRLGGSIDGVSGTDGIAWHGGNFGAPFTSGILFMHDAANSQGSGLNIKAVPWERIATPLSLIIP